MKIESPTKRSFLLLSAEEDGMEPSPSRRLAVVMDIEGFRGSYDRVWVGGDERRIFLTQAEELERNRAGNALLEGMSPGEFRLELCVVDSAGHVEVRAALHVVRQGYRRQNLRVEGEFELDPSELTTVVRNLRALLV